MGDTFKGKSGKEYKLQNAVEVYDLAQSLNIIFEKCGFNDKSNALYMSDLEVRAPGVYCGDNEVRLLTRECSAGVKKLEQGLESVGIPGNGLEIDSELHSLKITSDTLETLTTGLGKTAKRIMQNAHAQIGPSQS